MTWLILGLALWWGAHLFKRVAPTARDDLAEKIGDKAKGFFAGLLVLSVVLMVIGYRRADVIAVFTPIPGIGHLNNLLMIIAFLMFGAGSVGSWLSKRMRHPMLTGFIIWAIAHLLVNGDLASVILFGGLLIWAVVEIVMINASAPAWSKSGPAKPAARDLRLFAIWAVMFVIVAGVHVWLGHNPFLGTYG